MPPVSDTNLLVTIKDYLEMGHVDNIVAMFHRDPAYFSWTGAILDDGRFQVRLGVSVLFEELKKRTPDRTELAIPSLVPLLQSDMPYIRGEATSVLGIIGTTEARGYVAGMITDSNPQVREIAEEIICGPAVAIHLSANETPP